MTVWRRPVAAIVLVAGAWLCAGCSPDRAASPVSPAPTTPATLAATATASVIATSTVSRTSESLSIGSGTLPAADIDAMALGGDGCRPPSPLAVGGGGAGGGPEVRGTASDGIQINGLVLAAHGFPLRVGDEIKIVWRMTGSGPLVITVAGPDGSKVPLQWGPDAHDGSNYERPGDEWGAGFLFPTAGCWRVHLSRGNAAGDAWFDIAPPS